MDRSRWSQRSTAFKRTKPGPSEGSRMRHHLEASSSTAPAPAPRERYRPVDHEGRRRRVLGRNELNEMTPFVRDESIAFENIS